MCWGRRKNRRRDVAPDHGRRPRVGLRADDRRPSRRGHVRGVEVKPAAKGKISDDRAELGAIEKRIAAVTTVAEVRELTAAAAKLGRAGRDVDDDEVVRLAFSVGRRLERQGGLLLMTEGTPPPDLPKYTARRWLRLAALSPEAFRARLKVARSRQQNPRPCRVSSVKMCAGEWTLDPVTGVMSREIWANSAVKS